jgi:hypothetical protein
MKVMQAAWLAPVLAALAGTAAADTLTAGGTVVGPTQATLGSQPQLAGSIVAQSVTPFSYEGWYEDDSQGPNRTTGTVSGSVESMVVHSTDGSYDFYWRVTVDRGAFLPIANFSIDGFAPGSYNTGWRGNTRAGGVTPALVQEDASGHIDFAFGQYVPPSSEVNPAAHSYWLFLDTNAHGWNGSGSFALESERDSGGDMLIDWGGNSDPFATYAPVWAAAHAAGAGPIAPVPEPGTVWLALGGLGVLGGVLRRQRRG